MPEDTTVSLSVAGVASLWDIFLQDWLHRVHAAVPELIMNVDVASADVIRRRLLDNTLELGFMFEVPQLDELEAVEVSRESLILVSSSKGQSAEQALSSSYVLVDWGTSFAMAHARYYPEAPPPVLRTGLGRMAREFILNCGGAAYLAKAMVEEDLAQGKLHIVTGAPEIARPAHAVYQVASAKQQVLQQVILLAQKSA